MAVMAVLDIASYIKSIVKTDPINIDNIVFRLHYRVTVAILIAASIVGLINAKLSFKMLIKYFI